MKSGMSYKQLFDHLEVGISVTTWHPHEPSLTEWVFVNHTRCRMTDHTAEELFRQNPVGQVTRETMAQFQVINEMVESRGHFTCESTLRHRSHEAVPVILHFKLDRFEGVKCLITESHDISAFKAVEKQLQLSRDSTSEMLTLIEKEKQKIIKNIKNNLTQVLFPLMDQLRITATGSQKEVLALMEERIGQMTREMGISPRVGIPGVNLTRRQILICEMIRDGLTSKEIALALDCAPSTINNHRNIIRRKLNLDGSKVNLQGYLNRSSGGS